MLATQPRAESLHHFCKRLPALKALQPSDAFSAIPAFGSAKARSDQRRAYAPQHFGKVILSLRCNPRIVIPAM